MTRIVDTFFGLLQYPTPLAQLYILDAVNEDNMGANQFQGASGLGCNVFNKPCGKGQQGSQSFEYNVNKYTLFL